MPNKSKYQWVRLPKYLIDDSEERSTSESGLTKEEIIEKLYFGYEVKEEVAENAKDALIKQITNEILEMEPEKFKVIENWWRRRTKKLGTEIVKSCEDILREEIKKGE